MNLESTVEGTQPESEETTRIPLKRQLEMLWPRVSASVVIALIGTALLMWLMFNSIVWQGMVIALICSLFGSYVVSLRWLRYQFTIEEKNKKIEAMNRQHKQIIRELTSRNTELDAFAHTVAHDLKNPLGLVVGYSAILRDDIGKEDPEELRDYADLIFRNGVTTARIIDDLLLFAGVRSERVNPTPLEMDRIIDRAWNQLQILIDEHSPTLTTPDEWPAALGYAPWVEAVWRNLLSNAIKYGGFKPHITAGADLQANGMIRFWVRDEGMGISAEQKEALFEAFERGTQSDPSEGHGLGLSIVQRIVTRLGGEVGAESERGSGSTFWFTLRKA